MNHDQLHEEAVRLLLARQANGKESEAKAIGKSYNQRRREATAALQPILTKIWDALAKGESVGGYTSKEDWAKSQSATEHPITIRQIQRIIAGTPQKRHHVALKEGMLVKVGDKVFTITSTAESVDDLHRTKEGSYRLDVLLKGDPQPKKVKKAKSVACKLCGYKKCQCAEIQARAAAKLDKTRVAKGVRIGDEGEPYAGFYWKYCKAAKPYGVFAIDTETYGTAALIECNSESEANAKIREYGNERANAETVEPVKVAKGTFCQVHLLPCHPEYGVNKCMDCPPTKAQARARKAAASRKVNADLRAMGADEKLLEEWCKTHSGTVDDACKCEGLSKTTRNYVSVLLENLADEGRVPVINTPRQIGQYTAETVTQ